VILYPAIDMRHGAVVRLHQGDFAQTTVYAEDPVAQARAFAELGFSWLHLVDLDGAVEGAPRNAASIEAIRDATSLSLQLGGGIRSAGQAEYWLDRGIDRLILGTAALKNPELLRTLARDYPGRIAVGIDARDGLVAVEGWLEASEISALELAQRYEDAGVAALIHTDIARDGALSGPNIEASAQLADAVSIPLIVSGGVARLDDLLAAKAQAHRGFDGIISGRALYDGRLDPKQALEALAA
jgi:phosphoribosylformimino-5-aminoimidazole carboxamide ribotide isomerase